MTATIILLIRTALAATAIAFLMTSDAPQLAESSAPRPVEPPASRAADADGPSEPDGRPSPPIDDDRPGTSPQERSTEPTTPLIPVFDPAPEPTHDTTAGERGETDDLEVPADPPTATPATRDDATERDAPESTVATGRLALRPSTDGEHVLGEVDVTPGQGPDGFVAAPRTGGESQIDQGPTDMKIGPSCAVQCITGGVVYARGVGAQLFVWTDTPADIWINVYRPGFADPQQSPNPMTAFSWLRLDLEPGTEYEVLIAATDSHGHTAYATGSFTTLRRSAVVTFGDVQLVSSSSSSSVLAYTRVDGSWTAHGAPIPHDGQTVALNFAPVHLTDTGRMLDVLVQLAQASAGSGGKLCEAPELPVDDGGGGTISCYHYNSTGGVAIDLDHRPPGATSWTEHTLELLPGSSPIPIEFWVPVTIQVTYH